MMAKTRLDKPNENEPFNKKMKTMKLDEEKKQSKNKTKPKDSPNRSVNKLQEQKDKVKSKKSRQNQAEKSSKLKAKDEVKSDELKAQRHLRRQKKKMEKLKKKKPNQQKKNQHLNTEQKLSSIFHQQDVHHKTIINHYKNLAAKVSGDCVIGFVKQIKELILDESLHKELKNNLVNDLYRFINILNNQQNDESLMMLTKFCALNAYFSSKEDDNVVKNIEQETVNCFKNCFHKIITLIIRNSTNKKKKELEKPKLDQLYQITKHIYTLINSNERNEKENYNSIFKKISNSYKQIQLKDDNKNEQSIVAAFFVFYVFLGVNLFEENCMPIVDEVNECFKRFTSQNSTDDLHWADVFTDIILSLLSTGNHMKRAVCDEVFGLISKEITSAGLEQLMNALISDNIEISDEQQSDLEDEEFVDAQEQLSDDEAKEETDEEEDEQSEELNSDLELNADEEDEANDLEVDENCAIEQMNVDESDSESSEESGIEESDTESIDDEFRRKIKNALGKAAVGDESEDEVVYDDEQMFEFDEAISKVFQEKKKVKNKTQDLIEFKSRCFDLVHVVINTKNIDFLVQIAKNTLQVLSTNNTPKSYDLILKASTALKKYQTIEHSKLSARKVKSDEMQEILKTSLRLVQKLPEKVRNNLNCFIVWLLDLCKSADVTEVEQLVLGSIDKKLKKSPEISLLIQLAERKKQLAQSIFNQLIKLDLTTKLTNFELYSFYKLIIACCLNLDQSVMKSNEVDLIKILDHSIDILNQKKSDLKAKFVVEETIRFLALFIKNNLELVKSASDLVAKLGELNNQSNRLRLSKKLRQRWNFTLKQL